MTILHCPLYVDTSFNTVWSYINNVVIAGAPVPQNVSWTSAAATLQVSGNSLTKVSGTASWYDVGAVSSQAVASGNGYVAFTPGSTTTGACMGWAMATRLITTLMTSFMPSSWVAG